MNKADKKKDRARRFIDIPDNGFVSVEPPRKRRKNYRKSKPK